MVQLSKEPVVSERAVSSLQRYMMFMERTEVVMRSFGTVINVASSSVRGYSSMLQTSAAQSEALSTRTTALAQANEALAQSNEAVAQETQRAASSQEGVNRAMESGAASARNFLSHLEKLKNSKLVQGTKQLMDMSDSFAQTSTRLDLINSQYGTRLNLEDRIFAAAERSRGTYQETANLVTNLGLQAKSVFQGPEEIVAFAEQLNNHLVLSGTSATQAQGAVKQLTAAMSSGVLEGAAFQTIMTEMPTVAQAIADHMGVTVEQAQALAAQGGISASTVKGAMFSMAETVEQRVAEMPATWSQVFGVIKDNMLQAIQPILGVVGSMAQWVGANLETLMPILLGVAAAIGEVSLALQIYNAVTAISDAVSGAFFKTLLKNPLLWIGVIVGVIVAAFMKWSESVGGVGIAFAILKDTVLTGLENLYLKFVDWYVNVSNGFGDFKVALLTKAQDLLNGLVDMINGLIEWANKVFGTSFDTMERFSFATDAMVENESNKAANEQYRNEAYRRIEENQRKRKEAIAAAKEEAAAQNTPPGEEYIPDITENTADIAGNVGSIKKSVSKAEEDLKSLVDYATRQYVNKINLTSQSPIITVNGANTGDTAKDRNAIAEAIMQVLYEQSSASSNKTYVQPVSG